MQAVRFVIGLTHLQSYLSCTDYERYVQSFRHAGSYIGVLEDAAPIRFKHNLGTLGGESLHRNKVGITSQRRTLLHSRLFNVKRESMNHASRSQTVGNIKNKNCCSLES